MENEFEFRPGAKIFLATNHEPRIRGTDEGIWRRLWLLPFTVTIPEDKRDPGILDKLEAEGSGILNWCIEGLRALPGERPSARASGEGRRGNGTVPIGVGRYREVPRAGDEGRPPRHNRADGAI